MHGVMIAIEYSYKLDRKKYFNLWCEIGQLLLGQSQMSVIGKGNAKKYNGQILEYNRLRPITK